MKISMGRYRKTAAAVVVQLLAWSDFVINSPAKAITAQEWHLGAFMVAVALGVYAVANDPVPTIPTP